MIPGVPATGAGRPPDSSEGNRTGDRASTVRGPGGQRRWVTAAIVILALTGVLVVILDWRDVRDVLAQADWRWIPLVLALTAFSYLCLSQSFTLINQSFGIQMSRRDLFEVGFVSSAKIAAVGGLAGHSLRVLMMARRGLAAGDVMAPSLFHGYLESLLFFALIPAGLVYLLLTHPLSSGVAVWLSIGTGLLGLAFAITAVVFFYGPARSVALRLVRRFWRLVARRDMAASVAHFESTLALGLASVRQRPLILAWPVALVLADRVARVAVIWLCFQALGSDVSVGVAITGFAIGIAAGVMSMIPGGVAVQEGSMAGTYHLLGVPLEEAVLVSLLFRVVYYMAPFAISLAFYHRVMKAKPEASGFLEQQPVA